ncbi:hypothetical protein P5673_015244 [Acropora cervicornis]|uniref:Uncharacterized protein n=1 Tax=Acropora cervicornis TaxID=6130 RepID=A0AAD9QIA3_ACRCE|nr:hypothetical protein P5673_015244 [Acropora cervicornis]
MSVPSRLPLRQQDSAWSCLVCFCATVLQTVSMGLATTFGVLFPVIMEHFDANRQQTVYSCTFRSVRILNELFKLLARYVPGSFLSALAFSIVLHH